MQQGCNAHEWNAGASQCCGDDGPTTEDWDRDNYAATTQCCLNGALLSNGVTSSNYYCYGANPQIHRCGGTDTTGTVDTEAAHCDLVGTMYCDLTGGIWTAEKPNGCPAEEGDECVSGLVVNGVCRNSCDGFSGLGCSNDANPYYSPLAGTCYDDLGATFGCDYTAEQRMNCGVSCSLTVSPSYLACNAASGDACDSDVGGNFTQDGLCTASGCDTVSHACFDDVNYQSDCSSCSLDYDLDAQGDTCDSTLTNADYSSTGICVTGTPSACAAAGTTVRANVNNGNIFTSGCDMSGSRCDTSVSTIFSADGVCASSLCDAVDVVQFGGAYYGNCDGRGGVQCDTDTSNGVYAQNGMCFDDHGMIDGTDFDCESSGFIFYNGTMFLDDSLGRSGRL
jgi:hypothetical protein